MKNAFENINLGLTYREKYLNDIVQPFGLKHSGLTTVKRVKTKYGWHIVKMSNYIAIYTTRLEVYPDGTAKAVTKVNKNYYPKYQYTLYFDKDGKEIKDKHNRTRKELHYWKTVCKK